MRKVYLTSSPFGSYREWGKETYAGLNPANGLIEELRRDWPSGEVRGLAVAAAPDAYSMNDQMAGEFAERFCASGLTVTGFDVCDWRNSEAPLEHPEEYGIVIFCGGHVPTQNAFLHQIGFPQKIAGFTGIVMGISAGTMNCADLVYAQPELEGESCDPQYRRFIPGLGLTSCNVLPHYQAVKNDVLDGRRLMEDITYPDSRGRYFYALPDGSFILKRGESTQICGEAWEIRDGQIRKICEDGKRLDIFE